MITDFLRVMRVQDARFFRGSLETRPIRWLRARPGAQVLPIHQAFGYPVWDGDHMPPLGGVGIIKSLGAWASSLTSTLPGNHFEGPAPWWLQGAPGSASLLSPPTCAIPLLTERVGIVWGAKIFPGVAERVGIVWGAKDYPPEPEKAGIVFGAKEVPDTSYAGKAGIVFGAKEVPDLTYVGQAGIVFGAKEFTEDLHGSLGLEVGAL